MKAVLVHTKMRQIMSKRLALKLAVTILAFGAVTLLQGCGEDDDLVYSFVWQSPNSTAVFMGGW
jgi:hypothetical protein